MGEDDIMAEEYEASALEQASSDAAAQIARFLSLSFTSDSDSERGNSLERSVEKDAATGKAGADIVKKIIADRLSKNSVARASARLSGVETLKEWSWQMPDGPTLVGCVKAYRFAGIENARKALAGPEMQPEQQPSASSIDPKKAMNSISSQGSVESSFDVL